MRDKINRVIWLLLPFIAMLLPRSTFAQVLPPEQQLNALDPTIAVGNGPFQLIDQVMNRLPFFLGGLAFLAILYSGAIYITAFGDPTRMETAKKNLTWTIIGVLAAASVFIVIKLILWIANPYAIT